MIRRPSSCMAAILLTLFVFLFATTAVVVASPTRPKYKSAQFVRPYDSRRFRFDRRTTHTGRATWFYVGLGNCGFTDTDNMPVIAISKARYDDYGGVNCNQWINITNINNGKFALGYVRDSCQACGYNDLDLSPSLFQQLDSLDTGTVPISWHFKRKDWQP